MNKNLIPFEKPIYITKPMSPSVDLFIDEYKDIQNSGIYSNFGQKHNQLEKELKAFLGVKNLALFNNGTTALIAALKALDLSGEVVTTPYTFPATVNAIKLSGLTPVFCDIDFDYNIDCTSIEKCITSETSAILAVHTFGIPCEYEKIQKLADSYNLKVIYDAAHAFNVSVDNKTIGTLGDISMFSFHATKIFNTIEGGCLCTNDETLLKKIQLYRNFGFNGDNVDLPGLNGKLNEIQSVVGLLNLPKVKEEIENRKILVDIYNRELFGLKELSYLKNKRNVKPNYQYYIIRLSSSELREYLYKNLQEYNVFTRKYFSPCAVEYSYIQDRQDFANAQKASSETLALPLYGSLTVDEVVHICSIIKMLISSYNGWINV